MVCDRMTIDNLVFAVQKDWYVHLVLYVHLCTLHWCLPVHLSLFNNVFLGCGSAQVSLMPKLKELVISLKQICCFNLMVSTHGLDMLRIVE